MCIYCSTKPFIQHVHILLDYENFYRSIIRKKKFNADLQMRIFCVPLKCFSTNSQFFFFRHQYVLNNKKCHKNHIRTGDDKKKNGGGVRAQQTNQLVSLLFDYRRLFSREQFRSTNSLDCFEKLFHLIIQPVDEVALGYDNLCLVH